jgi:hypothetical protein
MGLIPKTKGKTNERESCRQCETDSENTARNSEASSHSDGGQRLDRLHRQPGYTNVRLLAFYFARLFNRTYRRSDGFIHGFHPRNGAKVPGELEMPEFNYQERSLRDVVVRIVQTDEETDKAPKVELEEKCARCQHERWAHCFVRRSLKKRCVLWVCEYGTPGNRQIDWQLSRRRGLYPVKCRHFLVDQDFPLCSSSSCSRLSCDCKSFVSPYKKLPKKATAKPRAPRKRNAKAQARIDFEATPG